MNVLRDERDSDSGLTWRDTVLTQLATLNTQMKDVVKKDDLSRMEWALKSHAHDVAEKTAKEEVGRQHDLCVAESTKRESVAPKPVMSPKGWETIRYIATLIAASILGGGGFAGIQQIFK